MFFDYQENFATDYFKNNINLFVLPPRFFVKLPKIKKTAHGAATIKKNIPQIFFVKSKTPTATSKGYFYD
jgi:hypothetical protein